MIYTANFKNEILWELQNFTSKQKKTGAGHYLVTVTDEANNEIKSYTETDMQIIDALSEEDGMYDMSQWDAMQIVIRKAGFDN